MTICLGPRGGCGGWDFRSRFTCRVFGRASIFASPFLVRRRMTRMALAGYPALQYLQSGRVRNFQLLRRMALADATALQWPKWPLVTRLLGLPLHGAYRHRLRRAGDCDRFGAA